MFTLYHGICRKYLSLLFTPNICICSVVVFATGYLSRLVDVEQMRGAKGGDIFKAQLVGDETNIPDGRFTTKLKCDIVNVSLML
jgi:hypothetical protein